MKKQIILLGILFFTIITLFVVRSVVSNKISTSGLTLGDVQSQIAGLKTENAILKEKVYSQSSLTHLYDLASKKGFVESDSNFSVKSGLPLARK